MQEVFLNWYKQISKLGQAHEWRKAEESLSSHFNILNRGGMDANENFSSQFSSARLAHLLLHPSSSSINGGFTATSNSSHLLQTRLPSQCSPELENLQAGPRASHRTHQSSSIERFVFIGSEVQTENTELSSLTGDHRSFCQALSGRLKLGTESVESSKLVLLHRSSRTLSSLMNRDV
ncbi:unnamed protein product, partial [Brassica oleracea]